MSVKTLWIFLFFLTSYCDAMKVSVIVPCYWKHVQFLPELLEKLGNQTTIPDEVVISISEAHLVSKELSQAITNKEYPFKLIIIETNNQLFAGENRNKACESANGDIFLCQDADDLPHPQRVEIIKYYFEKCSVMHLAHSYYNSEEVKNWPNKKWPLYQLANITSQKIKRWDFFQFPVHNGNIAVKREIWQKIKWPAKKYREDVSFNRMVTFVFRNSMAINAKLILYRNELSTLPAANSKKEKRYLDLIFLSFTQ